MGTMIATFMDEGLREGPARDMTGTTLDTVMGTMGSAWAERCSS